MKDCRDCKWSYGLSTFARCHHPQIGGFYASTNRAYDCGSQAKYFEPKPPPVAWRDRISMAWRILRGEIQPETKQDPPAYVVGQWSE